jgi:hypothetical protein
MGVNVNETRRHDSTCRVNHDITVQVGSDFGDVIAFNQYIGEEAWITCSVDN